MSEVKLIDLTVYSLWSQYIEHNFTYCSSMLNN